ncbi:MAG: M24 family metallopeptidase [Bacillota bacterium]
MERLQIVRKQLPDLNLDALLVTNPQNRRYLSGFSGSAGVLLLSSAEAFIVTDFRYWEQVDQEVKEFALSKQGPNLWQSVSELIQKMGWNKVGFEANSLTFQEHLLLREALSSNVSLIPTTDLIEKQRWVKDGGEIKLLAEAARITDKALAETLATIKPGIQEREIALEFDYQLRLNGAEGNSFTTIAISGQRTALPHGAASARKVAPGDLVLIDGGALYQGYHGDLTRTVVLGKASVEQKRIYRVVLEAQQKALDYLKAGLLGYEVDKVARDFLADQGFRDYFGHGLGHSVGLNIHESPRLAPTEANPIPAAAVITVEPGVYIPGWGGVRIEDLVVVTDTGIHNLTGSPKEDLLEL